MRQLSLHIWIDSRYALAAVVLALLSVVLGILAGTHDTFPLDQAVMERVQTIGSGYEPVAEVFNEYNWLLAILAFSLGTAHSLVRGRPDAALLFLLTAGLRPYLNQLKAFVDRPRPVGDFPVLDVVNDSSFPSGHVMTAVAYFGLMFVLAPEILPRRAVVPARLAIAAIVVLYALSRMWAGVHWFSDVYGALLWSSLLLAVLLAFRPTLGAACDRVTFLLRDRTP